MIRPDACARTPHARRRPIIEPWRTRGDLSGTALALAASAVASGCFLAPGIPLAAGLAASGASMIGAGVAVRAARRRSQRLSHLEGWLSTVDVHLPDMLFEINAAGRIVGATHASTRVLGRSPESITGRLLCEFTMDPLPYLDSPAEGDEAVWAARWIHADGQAVHHIAVVHPQYRDGTLIAVRGVLRDASGTAAIHDAVRASEERFRHALDAMQDGMMIVDATGAIVLMNRALRRVLGWGAAQPTHLEQIALQGHLEQVTALVASRVWSDVGGGVLETRLRRLDGSTMDAEVSVSALRDEDGPTVIMEVRDLTERRRASETLRRLADYDRLTGLPNRDLFDRHLQRAIVDARQHRGTVAVLLLDIDRFKLINDTLGHPSGDRLLKAVADRLNEHLAPPHVLARFGGDEFLVLAPNLPVPRAAEATARRVRTALAEPFEHEGHTLQIAASVGISLYPDHAPDSETLIRIADNAVHRVKEDGGDGYRIGNPAESGIAQARLALEADLRLAVQRGEFALHYQPQIDPATHRVHGMEALLRWPHEDRGFVSPAVFVPLLEETGLIVEVGQWVLEEACRQVQVWRQAGLTDARIAVNLSPRQLIGPGVDRMVQDILARTGLPASALELELTETTSSLSLDDVLSVLEELRGLGVTTAIDDFGIGHSWLGRLRQFPVHTLKIDRSFVAGMEQSADDRHIVEAVVALGHALGLVVVAEGVETEAQLALVNAAGCDLVQGYYYSPALAPEAFEAMLRGEQHSSSAA